MRFRYILVISVLLSIISDFPPLTSCFNMYLTFTFGFLACLSIANTIDAQPLVLRNVSSGLGIQEASFHPPFRYFKLLDDSDSTITQLIGDPAADAVVWQGGQNITAGNEPSQSISKLGLTLTLCAMS